MPAYKPPLFLDNAFNCPHCGVLAQQRWYKISTCTDIGVYPGYQYVDTVKELRICFCQNPSCDKYSLWFDETLIYPLLSTAPLPSEDMPEDVKDDYLEARNVVEISPRSAAALLRLSLQKLMKHLGENGDNINQDIGNLVKKGLLVNIQKSLDSVRVIGNEAVHPGELDLKDDRETAIILFKLLNIIIESMITQPKEIDKIYNSIPPSKIQGIINRDNSK